MNCRQPIARGILGVTVLLATACGAASPAPATPTVGIGDAQYEAILATAYIGLLADARDAARCTYASREAAERAAAPFVRPRMDRRIRAAMWAHGVSEAEMMEFAQRRPGVVRAQNVVHARRMRHLRAWAGRIVSRVQRRDPGPELVVPHAAVSVP
jgi:hypothetical protein